MASRERRIDRGRRQARRRLTTLGEELHEGRLAAGLSQRQLGEAAGISHTEVSRIEHAKATRVPYETLAIVGAVLGLDIPLRAYPESDPVRDIAHVSLLARLRSRLPAGLTWRSEVPLQLQGDRRAWDAVIGGTGWRLPIDAETRLRDIQALARRVTLKFRDDGAQAMVLLVADTRHNRHILRLAAEDLAAQFPVRGSAVLASLEAAQRPAGSGVILL